MNRRSSIAVHLFLLVFGFSAAWFTVTTTVQAVFEYQYARQELDDTFVDLYRATHSGLESALWNYDLALVASTLEATRDVAFLSGAKVRDENLVVRALWGQVPAGPRGASTTEWSNRDNLLEPLVHRFPLWHDDGKGIPQQVGELTLAANLGILEGRLVDRIRLIVSNYVASTLGLMVILLLALHRLVAQPLGRITRAIGAYRFDQAGLPPLDRPLRRHDELHILWTSFEALTATLKETYLQQRVMSAIVEEAAVMALVCDDAGTIVFSNSQARARLVGGDPGGTLGALAYGGNLVPLFPEVPLPLAPGAAWRGEIEVPSVPGPTCWLAVSLLPLRLADDPRARWGVLVEDKSAQKLTDRYREERDRAQASTRAKSLFLANLSHEIRTPMNAVVGLTALALDEKVSPRARSYLSQLSQSGAALLEIINDILDYSKLEEGKLELEDRAFSMVTVLAAVEAMARFRAEAKGLRFRVLALPLGEAHFRGDALRFQQILVNLVSNAVKFTDRGEVSVDVATRPGPGDNQVIVRVEVTDTGIGISEADQARLFQSFTQVDASTTRQFGGTGLGLVICRQLAQLMGGSIGLSSTLGEGSRFWVEVPLTRSAPVAANLAGTPGAWSLAGLRVLLVEDNKVNQLVAREILGKQGVLVSIVSDGQQAVDRVGVETFDLVLMDLQMPVMDGLEATRRIRKAHPAEVLPILAMTAHSFPQERETCLEAGMQDLIPKPVDPQRLYEGLSRWRPGGSRTEPDDRPIPRDNG